MVGLGGEGRTNDSANPAKPIHHSCSARPERAGVGRGTQTLYT